MPNVLPPNAPAKNEPFLVGEFLVLPEQNELRQLDGTTGRPRPEPIRLTAKQMDVLVTLAARPGQPVGKTELFEAVWPGVVVGEDNITSCIYELRKAFGEQTYIRTVRQRGYVLTPSVVRPLPQRLLDELEPERPGSAEILLAETGVPAAASGPDSPALAIARLESPEALDRWGRRQIALWLGALALVVAIVAIGLRRQGGFTFGLQGFSNATGSASFDEMSRTFEERFDRYFRDREPTYYRLTKLWFFASVPIKCTVSLQTGDRLELTAEIGGENEKLSVSGPRDSGIGLSTQLFESIGRVLDTRACRVESAVDLLKARSCYDAGARQLKSRNPEAESLLLDAARFFLHLADQGSTEAAERLLFTYDLLANSYDIKGDRRRALEQIDLAVKVMGNASYGLQDNSVGKLRILRREAQIRGDVVTERKYLEELRDRDSTDTDPRHSLGWFLHTHDRNCKKAQNEFDEAIAGPDTDPALRAVYFSYKGDIQLDCGKPLEAIESYREHLRLTPDQADPFDSLAQALIMVGQYDKARAALNDAARLGSTTAILQKGNLERDIGNLSNADREYRTYIELSRKAPNSLRDGLIARGYLFLLRGQLAEARAAAVEATGLEGGNQVLAYWLLGLVNLQEKGPVAARADLKVLEGHFSATTSHYLREYLFHLRAQISLAEDHGEEAVTQLQSALANEPSDRLYFLAAEAEALAQIRRTEEAFAVYGELLTINPFHPRALCAAANLATSLALPGEAAELYRRAQENLDPQTDDLVGRKCLERASALTRSAGDAP